MILDEELIFSAERAALCVEAFDGELRAVVHERAADRVRTGVDVDDAELDRFLGHRAAVQRDRGNRQGQYFLDHLWTLLPTRTPRRHGAVRSRYPWCRHG